MRGSTGTSGTKHKFVGSLGHPSEDDTGLIYMRARYMDPVTGRFASEDRARDGTNWFSYGHNGPTVAVDPDGGSAIGVGLVLIGLLLIFASGAGFGGPGGLGPDLQGAGVVWALAVSFLYRLVVHGAVAALKVLGLGITGQVPLGMGMVQLIRSLNEIAANLRLAAIAAAYHPGTGRVFAAVTGAAFVALGIMFDME